MLKVYPQFGQGENLTGSANYTSIDDIRAGPRSIFRPQPSLISCIKRLFIQPRSPPQRKTSSSHNRWRSNRCFLPCAKPARIFRKDAAFIKPTLTPLFDPIMALSDASRPGQSLLLLLELGLEPVGISTIILDQNNLMPLLGAAGSVNNILPVHVLETGAFLSVERSPARWSPLNTARPS